MANTKDQIVDETSEMEMQKVGTHCLSFNLIQYYDTYIQALMGLLPKI